MIRKAILTALMSAFILFGQTRNSPSGILIYPPPAAAFEELKANLGLSAAQVEQLVQIYQEKSTADRDVWRQVAEKQTELNTLLANGSRDLNRIGQLTLEIHTLSNQPPPSNPQWRQRALAVLTAEQKTKLNALDQALKLNTPAYQAVTLNLIDPPPPGRPVILTDPLVFEKPAP